MKWSTFDTERRKKSNSLWFPVTRDSMRPGVRLLEASVQQESVSLQLFCLLVLTKDIQRDCLGEGRAASFHASTESSPSACIPERSKLWLSDQTGFLGRLKPTLSRRHMRISWLRWPAATQPLKWRRTKLRTSLVHLVGGDAFLPRAAAKTSQKEQTHLLRWVLLERCCAH